MIIWKETPIEKKECEFEWEGYHPDFVEPVFSIVANKEIGPFCLWYLPLTENYRTTWEEGLIGDRCRTLDIAKKEAEEFYANREEKIEEIQKYHENYKKELEQRHSKSGRSWRQRIDPVTNRHIMAWTMNYPALGDEPAEIVECTDGQFSLFIRTEWHSMHKSFKEAEDAARSALNIS